MVYRLKIKLIIIFNIILLSKMSDPECYNCNCELKNNTNKRLISRLILCHKNNKKITFIGELFIAISLFSSIYIMNNKKNMQYIK